MNADKVENLIELYGWLQIPNLIYSREGFKIPTVGDKWIMPIPTRSAVIRFSRVLSDRLKWSIKKYIINQIETVSAAAGLRWWNLSATIVAREVDFGLVGQITGGQFKSRLISLVEKVISDARSDHRLWSLYEVIQWYIWCAENYCELGFCPAYALELEGMTIGGCPRGEAVRSHDPEKGPLHRSLELPLVIKALREDDSLKLQHLQEKAAVALSIALGRNPANLTYLKESDLLNLTPGDNMPCYVIRMPRIKKRLLSPRDDFMEEYLDTEFASILLKLFDANKTVDTTLQLPSGVVTIERPIFIKIGGNRVARATGQFEHSFNMMSSDINILIKDFVLRHNIISPITGEQLQISPRRFRYTLATNLAAEGTSKRELARILDHTDTQHVQVYFELAGNIVEHLDKASAKAFSKYLDFFKGKVIVGDNEAINGERDDKHLSFINEDNPTDQTSIGVCGESTICHLDPPFSCYLCPKFQPYKHADHEHVLESLLSSRERRIEKYENARLGIQLDDVILAVAQVVELCLEVEHV